MAKELHDLETYEVSMVPKGANGKNFLVFKNLKGQQGMKDAKEIIDWVTKQIDPKVLEEVHRVMKDDLHSSEQGQQAAPLSDKAKAALQAIARIASPVKGEIQPQHLVKVLQAAGYDMQKGMDVFGNPDGDVAKPDGEPPADLHDSSAPLHKDHMKAIPEDVLSDMKDVLKSKLRKADDDDEDEDDDDDMDFDDDENCEKQIAKDMGKAGDEAVKAYKAYMAKLGYRKYPDVQPRMKTAKEFKQVDVSQENHEKGEAQSMDVNKSLDLSKVDPKLKPALEAVFKANQEMKTRIEKAEKEAKSLRDAAREKEFVEKAAKLNVGAKTDDLAKILKGVADVNPELATSLETILRAAGEQIAKGSLFAEYGTSAGSSIPGDDAWSKIEKMAEGMVEKSSGKTTKAEAIEAVLKTTEGRQLYAEYMKTKPGMGL